MNTPRRNRARVLTPDALKQLRERVRSRENEENAGFKYTLERLGELTGLDPETVKNVLDGNGSDKRTIARCFETFGLTLEDSDHIPAVQASVAAADPNFVGRDEAIADLNTLVSRNATVIVIQARGGVGKTTLARKYLQQEFGSYLEFPIAKETKDIASIEGLIEEKLRQLGEEPGREFLVSLDRLKRKLQGDLIGILIDNLEPALDSTGKFIEPHRRYVELLRVLADPTVKSLTLITTRERLREPAVTVHHYALKSLDATAWEQFFQSRSLATDTPVLADLHNAHGGNAKAMDIVSGAILEDFSGDVAAYWRVNQTDLCSERDLEDLVTQQFDRLQQHEPDAYNLLCRMGCYRYQDVPTVPIEGLFCLLWDIPENRHRRVIKSLQDRSLVDCENGEFWLHPVIRAEAIARLRGNEDWETTNLHAAKFWTSSVIAIVTVEDALRSLEAYYHYVDIYSFEDAGNVLIHKRNDKWNEIIPLGATLYRFGLLEKISNTLNQIISHVKIGHSLSGLHNIMGDLNGMAGNLKQAIYYFKESCHLAESFFCHPYQVDSLKNIILCCMELGETEEAVLFLEKLNNVAQDIEAYEFLEFSHYCLTYLNTCSCISFVTEELMTSFAQAPINLKCDSAPISLVQRYSLLFLGLTYKNLGRYRESIEICNKVISIGKQLYASRIEAKANNCISDICRSEMNLEEALVRNLEAIEILRRINMKGDFAEAYYQLGLTYQVMEETEKSDENFQEAIRLFSEMEAPKQVERVRRSMQN